MPDALPLTGLFGKVPAHGDFVRRGLPSSFVAPWDDWLQAGMAQAREGLGAHWASAWDAAPAWRFALPAGACGPDAVAGVILPSEDTVGRRFPITLAAILPAGAAPPDAVWFDALEGAALAGRAGRADADALAAAIPLPGGPLPPVAAFPLPLPPPAMPDVPSEGLPGAIAQDVAPVMADDLDAASAWAPAAADDLLATFAAGPPALEPMDAPEADPALTGLLQAGGSGAITGPAAAAEQDDPLLALMGHAGPPSGPVDTSPLFDLMAAAPGAEAPADEDPLALLIGSGARPAPPAIAGDQDVLAGLISAAAPQTPALPEAHDILAGLAPPMEGGPDADAVGVAAAAIPEGADLLGGLVDRDPAGLDEQAAWPDALPAPDQPLTDVAPPAPEGGGWWTRGAAHVPPMVWAMPALPSPAEFAYLLEAEA